MNTYRGRGANEKGDPFNYADRKWKEWRARAATLEEENERLRKQNSVMLAALEGIVRTRNIRWERERADWDEAITFGIQTLIAIQDAQGAEGNGTTGT